ncbi:MAG: aminotransferase class V-fold PLP-dependent enzyme [Chloroflexota bacterium]
MSQADKLTSYLHRSYIQLPESDNLLYTPCMNSLHDHFLLDPKVTFLNHGSFGATPKPVFEAYQAWQRQLEMQPVKFIGRELQGYLDKARNELGNYLNTHKDSLVYIPNTTYGINVIARSLTLSEGDVVLTTNHEYGACDKTWEFMSQKKGFTYQKQPISLPFESNEAIIEQLWQGVTPKTKVIYLSHITSATAVIFPVAQICQRAREEGILTIIDGAHAPGQIDVDLSVITPDFYCGNLHKWLSAPKGSAFIYTKPDKQPLIEPLIVSWGWGENREKSTGSDYLDYLQFTGTNDLSAYLSVPNAIQFQEAHQWQNVREHCHALLKSALDQIEHMTGLPAVYQTDSFYSQMGITRLPQTADLPSFKNQLYDQFLVEIPCIQWEGNQFIRLSIQGYNTPQDIETLLTALQTLL